MIKSALAALTSNGHWLWGNPRLEARFSKSPILKGVKGLKLGKTIRSSASSDI